MATNLTETTANVRLEMTLRRAASRPFVVRLVSDAPLSESYACTEFVEFEDGSGARVTLAATEIGPLISMLRSLSQTGHTTDRNL